MITEVYVNTLDTSILTTLWQHFGIVPFLYQHANQHVHKAKVIPSCFEDNQVDVMNWSAQSIDLNPIEHH